MSRTTSTTQRGTANSSSASYPLPAKKATSLISDLVLLGQGNIRAFRRKWDRLYKRYDNESLLEIANELRLLWWHAAKFRTPLSGIDNLFQHTTRTEQLENDYELSGAPQRGVLFPQYICERWLQTEKKPILIHWRSRQVKANPANLPTVLALTCLNHWPYLRVCMNSECRNRYFIAARKDQRFCSPECAEPARLAAKLKWWHENRGNKKKGGA